MTPTNKPQSIPIAPLTGYTSRYDSDVDDVSLGALSDDEHGYEHGDGDGYSSLPNSSYQNSSLTNSGFEANDSLGFYPDASWISVADTIGPDDDSNVDAENIDGTDTAEDAADNNDSADDGANSNNTESKAIAIRPSSTLYLPSLPLDTFHRLSTFLTAKELHVLECTTTSLGRRVDEVKKRVWGHTGRCLGEVYLAWVSFSCLGDILLLMRHCCC